MRKYYIYKIVNTINNKVYIGKTYDIGKRFNTHIKNAKNKLNRRLYDAINKYGIENFIIEKVEECDESNVNNREIYWINFYNSTNKNFGYNMTRGGDGGNTYKNLSPEQKKEYHAKWIKSYQKRLDNNGKRLDLTKEGRRNLSKKLRLNNGAKRPEVRKKISNTLKEKYKNGELNINIPKPRYGIQNSNYKELDPLALFYSIIFSNSIKDCANKFNVSTSVINARCIEYFGMTAMEIRKENNCRYAKIM